MKPASRDNTKRKRPAQAGTLVGVRLQPDQLALLDRWISTRGDGETRPEAIRRLLTMAMQREGVG